MPRVDWCRDYAGMKGRRRGNLWGGVLLMSLGIKSIHSTRLSRHLWLNVARDARFAF